MDVFSTVGFLHLADVPVEVGVGPTHELGPLGLAVLVAVPGIGHLLYLLAASSLLQWLGKQMTTR